MIPLAALHAVGIGRCLHPPIFAHCPDPPRTASLGKERPQLEKRKGGRPWGATHTNEHHYRTNTMHRIAGKVPDSLQPAPAPTTTSLPDSEFMITIVLVGSPRMDFCEGGV